MLEPRESGATLRAIAGGMKIRGFSLAVETVRMVLKHSEMLKLAGALK